MSAIQALSVPQSNETRAVRAEHRATLRERLFQRLDRDGSGGVNRQEFATALQNLPGAGNLREAAQRVAAVVAHLDTDGDGQVSAGELDAALTRRDALRGTRAETPAAGAVGGLLAQLSAQVHGLRAQDSTAAVAQYARAAARGR